MKYVIIGNGVAGTTAAANIRTFDSDGKVIIISDDSYPFYSRIRLPEFLSGEAGENDLIIRKDQWYKDQKIELILNTPVSKIDPSKKQVITSTGTSISYDRLLLATGGYSFMPPIQGSDMNGVFTLRTLKDAIAIREYVRQAGNRILLIGGGVLGLEAGNGLRKAGNQITVVEFFPRLLPRQMDTEGAGILQAQMEKMGFKFHLGAKSKEIIGNGRAEALILEDNTRIDCDMIIVSAGVRPSLALAEDMGLNIERGLIVNDRMETGINGIFAAGDLVQHNNIFYGIWPAAEKQGEVAGINMAGGNSNYQGTTISNLLKVVGVDLLAAGDIDADGAKESVVKSDRSNFTYKKLVLENNTITGAILYGDISGRKKILKAIENKTDISGIRQELQDWNLENL